MLSARFIKFCIVGFSGVFIDMAFFWLLGDVAHWPIPAAKVVGTEAAIINNFLWNDLWTFAEVADARGRVRRLLSFNLVCGVGLLISLGLLYVQIELLGLNRYVANAITIGLVTAWNYGVNTVVSWGSPLPRPELERREQ